MKTKVCCKCENDQPIYEYTAIELCELMNGARSVTDNRMRRDFLELNQKPLTI